MQRKILGEQDKTLEKLNQQWLGKKKSKKHARKTEKNSGKA